LGSIEDALSERLSDALGVVEAEITELNLGKYSIAQAFSDSLIMATNFKPPLSSSVQGIGRRVSVRLAGDLILDSVVDLISIDGDQASGYFMDGHPMFYLDRSWVWRKPEVLAIGLLEAKEGDKPFPPITTAYYIHLYSGEILSKKALKTSRLQNIFIMASRGISANVFPPAFLSGNFSKCRACAMRTQCYDQEDVLESTFPGSYQTAKALASAVRKPATRAVALDLATKLTEFDFQSIELGE